MRKPCIPKKIGKNLKRVAVFCLVAAILSGSSVSAMPSQKTCPPHMFLDMIYSHRTSYTDTHEYTYPSGQDEHPAASGTCRYQQYQIHLRVRCAHCGLENGDMIVINGGTFHHSACELSDTPLQTTEQ